MFHRVPPFVYAKHQEKQNSEGDLNDDDDDDGDFWHGPDQRWKEPRVEQLISYVGNVRNYYFYGKGQDLVDRDLSALIANDDSLPDLMPDGPNLERQQSEAEVNHTSLPPKASYLNSSGLLHGTSVKGLYQTLPSDKHVRMLEILPGSGEKIECHLHVVVLEEAKYTYEALSYSWDCGPPEYVNPVRTHVISCNGCDTVVRHNLYSALNKMRRNSGSRMVWADALSINQLDLAERSHQVTLMSSIFKFAYRVYIWLGEDEADNDWNDWNDRSSLTADRSHRAFSDVCRIVNAWSRRAGLADKVPMAKFTSHLPTLKPGGGEMEKPLRARRSEWDNVLRLFRCRWFHRVWVIQEAAVAHSALVAWGDCEISWEWVGLAAAVLRTNYGRLRGGKSRPRNESRAIPTGVLNAYFIYRISESQRYFSPLRFSLPQLLCLTRQFNCGDSRDRVYGLLGLPTTDGVSKKIIPDYTKSSTEVYTELAYQIIHSSQSLNLLSSVQRPRASRSLTSCDPRAQNSEIKTPSWVPEWHVVITRTLAMLGQHQSFAASASVPLSVRDGGQSTKLTVRGVVLDRVSACVHSYWRCFWRGEQPDNFWGRDRVQESLEIILRDVSLTRSQLARIAMTITGGKNWYGLPVQDISVHLADFAKCLLKGGLLWAVKTAAFGTAEGGSSDDWVTICSDDSDEQSPARLSQFGDLDRASSLASEIVTMEMMETLCHGGNADRFLDAATTTCNRRARFTTGSGLIGVGPESMAMNDLVCVLYGGDMPFIITPKGNAFELVGECYIQDLMHGEAMEMLGRSDCKIEETWIELV